MFVQLKSLNTKPEDGESGSPSAVGGDMEIRPRESWPAPWVCYQRSLVRHAVHKPCTDSSAQSPELKDGQR